MNFSKAAWFDPAVYIIMMSASLKSIMSCLKACTRTSKLQYWALNQRNKRLNLDYLLFGKGEKQPLSDVVFPPEIRTQSSLLKHVFQRIFRGKQITWKWFELRTLRWINKLSNHYCLFGFVISKSPEELILVYKCKFCSCWVHMNLMH